MPAASILGVEKIITQSNRIKYLLVTTSDPLTDLSLPI